MILFLDTSALVKLYIAEPGSEAMRRRVPGKLIAVSLSWDDPWYVEEQCGTPTAVPSYERFRCRNEHARKLKRARS